MRKLLLASLVMLIGHPIVGMESATKKLRSIDEQGRLDHKLNQLIWGEIIWGKISDLAEIQQLLDNGANPNERYWGGDTALTSAVQIPKKEMCELLIKYGADVNTQLQNGVGALMYIATPSFGEAKKQVYKLLLEHGANPDLPDCNGTTALMLVARYGTIVALELLLQFNANPDIKNKEGKTATDFARTGQGYNNDSHMILDLLSNPEKIRAVILRRDNSQLQKRLGTSSNIHQALQNRELGFK